MKIRPVGANSFHAGRQQTDRQTGMTQLRQKAMPVQTNYRSLRLQETEAPRSDSRYMKVERMSALRTGYLYPARNIPGTHLCYTLSRSQGHSAAKRIMSMKHSNNTIWDRTRALPACRAVPQPTAPQHVPCYYVPSATSTSLSTDKISQNLVRKHGSRSH